MMFKHLKILSPKGLQAIAAHSVRSNLYHYNSANRAFGQRIATKELLSPVTPEEEANRAKNANLLRAVDNFRTHGHRVAWINPLTEKPNQEEVPELKSGRIPLNGSDVINPTGIISGRNFQPEISVESVIKFLQLTYTGSTGYEFMHIENEAEREWFAREIESRSVDTIPPEQKVAIALEMIRAENFDHFLASKFPTLKRYGGEGAESVMAFYMELFQSSARRGVNNIIVGMAHRGRLNFLSGILQVPPVKIFHKIKGFPEYPPDARASGDVLSHLGTSVDLKYDGGNVHVSLLSNPSHLEVVNPVAVGKARARQLSLKNYDYAQDEKHESPLVLCLQIHGDAALAGQGVNQETLGFAHVPNYRIGGSVHLVINNQLGFTTPQELGRSSRYTTDVGKIIGTPVIHVNADCPEDVAKAAKLALDYRQTFGKDIFVDLICFRRWGHNEGDDPTFTNPELYKIIHSRKSIPRVYADKLIQEGLLSEDVVKETMSEHKRILTENLAEAEEYKPKPFSLKGQWKGIVQPGNEITTWETGTEIDLLKYVGVKSVTYPEDFAIHPHLKKTYVKHRLARVTNGTGIDWATAEAMAIGSLLYQGINVRLSGEDVGRGTFSHRHAMLVDQETGEICIPLNSLLPNQQAFFEVANSTLSEEAVLGFEYGFSIENPHNLVMWEAQFGDFFNGAQIPIDNVIVPSESKWLLQTGLVMLLPHGMDGAGPEHSSCRIERFLQLTDSNESNSIDGDFNNCQVIYPTTPAQYFHLLRRQVLRNFRKPLVVVAPKILLRLSAAASSLTEMGPGTFFHPVIGDTTCSDNPKRINKLVFVAGKHYYALHERRQELNATNVAIIRVESLCPFPVNEIEKEIAKYPNASKLIWSQEEHRNQGAWTFIRPRFEGLLGRQIEYVGRDTLGAPAVGSIQVHKKEEAKILEETFS